MSRKLYPCCSDPACSLCNGNGVVEAIADPVIVYVVMTDSPGRGGSVFSVKATRAEADAAVAKLNCPADAVVYPWRIGSEMWDADYVLMLTDMKSES